MSNEQSAQFGHEKNKVREVFDHKRAFIIDDDPHAAPAVFHAVKKRRGSKDIHEIAVASMEMRSSRELYFFCFARTPSERLVNRWIAVPRPNQSTRSTYLGNGGCWVCRMMDKMRRRMKTVQLICVSVRHRTQIL